MTVLAPLHLSQPTDHPREGGDLDQHAKTQKPGHRPGFFMWSTPQATAQAQTALSRR